MCVFRMGPCAELHLLVCALEGDVEPCQERMYICIPTLVNISQKVVRERRTVVPGCLERERRAEGQVFFLGRPQIYVLQKDHDNFRTGAPN